MKIFTAFFLMILLGFNLNAQHRLVKLWETDSTINIPESVVHDPRAGRLYFSMLGNSTDAKDGIGGVGILGLDGQMIKMDWITGLNAPKGIAIYGNKLYVADFSDLIVIDIPKGKIELKISIEGAQFLNDVTVSNKGVVYVSDPKTRRIYQIINHKAALYMENIDGINGLKAVDDLLYIAGGKNLLKSDVKKSLIKVAGLPNNGDGIEHVGNGDFLFSSWAGYVYYVYADGRQELLLDTHLEKINTADLSYDPVKRMVYIPTFFKKSVVAYRLE